MNENENENKSQGLDLKDPRFERSVNYWKRQLRGRHGFCESDLDDLAQQIRIALWLTGGPGPSRTARFAAIDWYRKFKSLKKNEVYFNPKVPENSYKQKEEYFFGKGKECNPEFGLWNVKLQKSLRKLGERDQRILNLKYIQDLTTSEMAQEMKLSVARISSLLNLAEGKLKIVLMGRSLKQRSPQFCYEQDIRKRKHGISG